jgi:hypothetical protein
LGTRFVAKPLDHRIGWQRWAEKKPAETIMSYLHEGYIKPDRSKLGYHDESQWELDQNGDPRDPWQASESIPFVADNDEEFLFVTGSWGGHCALVKLQRAFRLDGMKRDPVIELATEKHKNQFGGVNQRPIFPVIGWVTTQPQQVALPKNGAAEIIDDIIPF